jgi:hypothetical protein
VIGWDHAGARHAVDPLELAWAIVAAHRLPKAR